MAPHPGVGLFFCRQPAQVSSMIHLRFALLLALVIACAGLTIWILSLAVSAGRLDQQVLFMLAPLAMLGSIAWRALRKDRDK